MPMTSDHLQLDPVAIASGHAITADRPAPDFFEGAIMGNGGMGVIVCTRPDAVVLHFGHNRVWDIRLAEENQDKLLTFNQILTKLRDTWDRGESIRDQDSWFRLYCRMARENYAKPYPRPFPCGTVVLGFDPRKTPLHGHRLNIADGCCAISFAGVDVELFVDQQHDRVWLSTRDNAPSPFNRVTLMPDDGGKPKDGWMANATVAQNANLPAPHVRDDGRSFCQLLPAREDFTSDPRDRAFELIATLNNNLGRIDLWEGLASDKVTLPAADYASSRDIAITYWADYWRHSAVELDDELLEAVWYRNLYFHATAARPGIVCPGIFGNWSKGDIGTAWHGDYHLDYNTQQAFWHCFSSNHPQQHVPYVDMVHHLLGIARIWARDHYEMRGACFPLSVYPVEMKLNPYPIPTWGWIMSVTPWAVQSLWWHYQYTMDKTFLRDRAWEPMREATLFLVDYLSRKDAHGSAWNDDRYHIVPTVAPELHGLTDRFERNHDCLVDITLIRFLFNAYLSACDILDRRDDLAAQVETIVNKLPDYPLADTPAGPVFVSVAGESPETVYNTPNAGMTAFPGEHHGLHSPPDELELARRTWRNQQTEGGNDLVFAALQGARLGILDLDLFKRNVRYCMQPNGACTDRLMQVGGRYRDTTDFDYMSRMGIWIENFAIPAVVNECLMQSYRGEIRLFPNWPAGKAARFQSLRAVGAFLVSSETTGRGPLWLTIESEVGETLRLINPWPTATLANERGDAIAITDRVIELPTRPGQLLHFTPADRN